MDIAIGFLTFGTLTAVAVFAFLSARQTEAMRRRNAERNRIVAAE